MKSLERLLVKSRIPRLFQRVAGERVAILAYHAVEDAEALDRQMTFLRQSMHPISLDRLTESIETGRRLPENAVLVTFDDGDRSLLDQGLPVLQHHGIPAVVFVVASLIGGDAPFWWEEVEKLLQRGITSPNLPTDPTAAIRHLKSLPDKERRSSIHRLREESITAPIRTPQLTSHELRELVGTGVAVGNHTLSHPCLDRCAPEVVVHEVVEAHRLLEAILGEPPCAFAYPNGNYDPRASRCLENLGYRAGFLFDHHHQAIPPSDPLAMSRLRVGTRCSEDRLRLVTSGVHPFLYHHFIRRLWGHA